MEIKHFCHRAVKCVLIIMVLGLANLAIAADIQSEDNLSGPGGPENQIKGASTSNGNISADDSGLTTFFSDTTMAVRYRLVEGSWLVDDCDLCDRPPIQVQIGRAHV